MTLFNISINLVSRRRYDITTRYSLIPTKFKELMNKGTKFDPTQKGLVHHINVICMKSVSQVCNKIVVVAAELSLLYLSNIVSISAKVKQTLAFIASF